MPVSATTGPTPAPTAPQSVASTQTTAGVAPGLSGSTGKVAAGPAPGAPVGTSPGHPPTLPPAKYCSPQLIELAMTALNDKTGTTQAEISGKAINAETVAEKLENSQQLQQLEKSNDKMQHAKKAGVFHKIFGWVANIAKAVVGVLAMATGAVVLGGLLLASAALALASTIINKIPAAQQWVSEHPGFHWTMVGIKAAVALAAAVVGVGTAKDMLKAGGKLAKEGEEMADEGIEMTERGHWPGDDNAPHEPLPEVHKRPSLFDNSFLTNALLAGQVTTDTTQVTGSAFGTEKTVFTSEANKFQADATRTQAELTGTQGLLQIWQDNLSQIVKSLQDEFSAAAKMMQESQGIELQNIQRFPV